MIYAPLTYVFLAAFVTSLAAGIFLISDFFATDEASMRLLLTFLPWVALVFVPALAMRAWADDTSDRSLELTFSLPLKTSAVVAGKFLAGAAVLLVALACTAAFPLSLTYLGEPDPGVMVASYLAAAAFLLTCFAMCLLASSLVRDPVSSFVFSVLLLLGLLLSGWDVFGKIASEVIPPTISGAPVNLSPKFWLDRMSNGYLEFAAVFYFFVTSTAALATSAMVLRTRRRPLSLARAAVWRTAGAVALHCSLLLAVIAAREVPWGLDLTQEREFTLPDSTMKSMSSLRDDVVVDVYWSRSEPSVPVAIKSHARRILDRLRVMASHSQGRLTLNVIDPRPDSEEELIALGSGIRRIPMTSGDHFFLGVTATSGNKTGRVAYLDPHRQQLLDYDFAVLLSNLNRKETRKLGILSPLITPKNLDDGRPGLSILDELKRAYDVAVIPHFESTLPDGIDVLLVLDATILKKEMLYSVDQFVMGGGGLVVLMDPQLRSRRGSNVVNPTPSAEINDISDLLQSYGVRYLGEKIVGDVELATTVMDDDQRQLNYPYWLHVPQERFSKSHPVTADLNELLFAEAAALDILPGSPAIPLVTTTLQSGHRDRGDFENLTPGQLAGEFKTDGRSRVVAAAIGARLRSAFGDDAMPTSANKHLSESTDISVVFVVPDIDWIFDSFALQKTNAEAPALVRPLNDNLTFLLNMLEFAGGDPSLIAIRSRGKLHRPFSHIANLFKDAQQRYRDKEAKIASRISQAEAELARIPQAAGKQNFQSLPSELKARITEVRKSLLPLRRELRAIRLSMREDIERLGRRLTIINLLAGPMLVLMFAAAVLMLRNRWRRR